MKEKPFIWENCQEVFSVSFLSMLRRDHTGRTYVSKDYYKKGI